MKSIDDLYALARSVGGSVYSHGDYGQRPTKLLLGFAELERLLEGFEVEKRQAYLEGVKSGIEASKAYGSEVLVK